MDEDQRPHKQAVKLDGARLASATQFQAGVKGHPEDANVALALARQDQFASQVDILGRNSRDLRRNRTTDQYCRSKNTFQTLMRALGTVAASRGDHVAPRHVSHLCVRTGRAGHMGARRVSLMNN